MGKGESMQHIHLAELDGGGGSVFAGLRFATPWVGYSYWALEPGEVRQIAGEGEDCEQGYVLLGGPAALVVKSCSKGSDETRGGRGASGQGPGYIVGPVGYDCELQNLSDRVFGVLHVKVAMSAEQMGAVAQDSFRDGFVQTGPFAQAELKWRDAIHGGCGKIATRHINPKEVLKGSSFSNPPLVKVGDRLLIVYETANLLLSVQGISMAKGHLGERIPVRNAESKMVVYAQVKSRNLVQVN